MKEGMKVKCPECGNQIPLEESEYNYYHDEPDLIILYDLAPKLILYLKEKKFVDKRMFFL